MTPLDPDEWQLSFDGETVSLYPSIGNYRFPCHSHYYITKNKVRWVIDDGCDEPLGVRKRKRASFWKKTVRPMNNMFKMMGLLITIPHTY